MTDLTHAEIRILLSENQRLTEELEYAHRDYAMVGEDNKELASRIITLQSFIGKVQGVCLGVAMSDCHPDPDGALMDIFHEAQEILFPKVNV